MTDAACRVNYAAGVSAGALKELSLHARRSLEVLDSHALSDAAAFERLLTRREPAAASYDVVLSLRAPRAAAAAKAAAPAAEASARVMPMPPPLRTTPTRRRRSRRRPRSRPRRRRRRRVEGAAAGGGRVGGGAPTWRRSRRSLRWASRSAASTSVRGGRRYRRGTPRSGGGAARQGG